MEPELVQPWTLLAAAAAYLTLLFGVAEAAERGVIPARWTRHPSTFALSLGVYATSWTFYGSVGLAHREGFLFLTIYLGVTLACLAVPVVWLPLLRVVRNQQLSSLADLFAYRFQSQTVGALVTVFMIGASLPYVALQIRAVSDSAAILIPSLGPDGVALAFCAAIAVFAAMFGARHTGPMQAHPGLVASMAFESGVKVVALVGVGGFALLQVFGGPAGLEAWTAAHPEALEGLVEPARRGSWASFTLLAFAAAFLLPRQFHMAFVKQPEEQAVLHAMWAFPVLLWVLNLPIPLILWAARKLDLPGDPDFWVLGLVAEHPALAVVVFLGGLAAASGMAIVCSLALAGMAMNHLVLPVWRPVRRVYGTVAWLRRGLVAAFVFAGYFTCRHLHGGVLVELGLITFVAVAQFLPGMVGVLFWTGATRTGFVAGLTAGIVGWAVLLILPLAGWPEPGIWLRATLVPAVFAPGVDRWAFATQISLFANGLSFVSLSLLGRPRPQEIEAAQTCAEDGLAATFRGRRSPEALRRDLERVLGAEVSGREVARACQALGLARDERRALKLAQLEDRVEVNLSGLFGPMVARQLMGRKGPGSPSQLADQVQFLEERGRSRPRTGPPGQADPVDLVRRFFGGVLEDLPLGVCAVASTGEVLVWNQVMVRISGLERTRCVGHRVDHLTPPWPRLLTGDAAGLERSIRTNGRDRILRVGASVLGEGGFVALVDDLTEQRLVEARLAHQDRLESIGRLAAGVAHEIGNPLAGMLMVARNLQRERERDEVAERLDLVIAEGTRIQKIVESMVAFSRSEGTSPEALSSADSGRVELLQVLQGAVRLVRLTHRDVQCHLRCPGGVAVRGDDQQLTQVFVNLLGNACDASPAGAEVEVETTVGRTNVHVAVSDRGQGIRQQIKEHIFEPFFTTKEPGRGTGLGLAIAHRIVTDHGGRIEVADRDGGGTRFVVELKALEMVS